MSSAISPAADVREALQSALVQVAERNCFAFAEAVDRFLAREGEGVEQYLEDLHARNPFRRAG